MESLVETTDDVTNGGLWGIDVLKVMDDHFISGIKVTSDLILAVPFLGNSERYDSGGKISQLVDYCRGIVNSVDVFNDGSNNLSLNSITSLGDQSIEVVLSLECISDFGIPWHDANTANAPLLLVSFLKSFLGVDSLMGSLEVSKTNVHDTS